jgi:hypothetical protein
VAEPVAALTLGAHRQHPTVVDEHAGGDEVVDDPPGVTGADGFGVGGDAAEHLRPQVPADSPLLDGVGEQLVGQQVQRQRRGHHRLHVSRGPQLQQSGRLQQGTAITGGEEQHVARGPRPSPGAPEALQERRHGGGAVDLDDTVEIAHVDAELEGAGGHDHAVAGLGERGLGPAPFVDGEGGVRHEGVHVASAQLGCE